MKNGRRVKLVVILAVICAVLIIGIRGMSKAWELQRRLACAEQMKRIGAALSIYGAATNAASPLDWLIESGTITSEDVKCPATEKPNYIVVRNSKESKIVLYEPTSNHKTGANVLFQDGHVSLVKTEDLPKVVGKNED